MPSGRRPNGSPIPLPTETQMQALIQKQAREAHRHELFEELNRLRGELGLPLHPHYFSAGLGPELRRAKEAIAKKKDKAALDAANAAISTPSPTVLKAIYESRQRQRGALGLVELQYKATDRAVAQLRELTLPYAREIVKADSADQIAGLNLMRKDPNNAASIDARLYYLKHDRHTRIGVRRKLGEFSHTPVPGQTEPTEHRMIGIGLDLLVGQILNQPGGPRDTRPDYIKDEDFDRLMYIQAHPEASYERKGPQWGRASEDDIDHPRTPHSVVVQEGTVVRLAAIAFALHIFGADNAHYSETSRAKRALEAIALKWIS